MTDTKTIPPLFTCIGDGKIKSDNKSPQDISLNIDLFNGPGESKDLPTLKLNSGTKKFEYTPVDKKPTNTNLNNYKEYNTFTLNGQNVKDPLNVGTHLKDGNIPDSYKEEQTVNMGGVDIKFKLNFIYVPVSNGVRKDFGEDKTHNKVTDVSVDAIKVKEQTDKAGIKVGFYHYLTGYPLNAGKSAKEIGVEQAKNFLSKLGYAEGSADTTILDGTVIPMVIFNDNITQKNYYGASPRGVKEKLNNF